MWFTKGHFDVKHKLAIISGGSQGVGAEFAKQLVEKGSDVIIVSRTESKLKKVVEQISKFRLEKFQIVSYIVADISNYEEAEKVFAKLDQSPDIVVCCAGSSVPKLFLDLSPNELNNGITTNYNTAVNFAHAAMKKMSLEKSTDPRHLIFFSSVVAFFPFIGYGQYAPLKAAVRALADVLRQEAIPYNIRVSSVFPGNFDSEGFLEENKTKPEITKKIEGPSYPISVETCAKIIIDSLDRGYETITTDFIGWVLTSISLGLSPRSWGVLQAIIGFVIALIAPIISWSFNRDIRNHFKNEQNTIRN
ncbi:3-ketodihydrosphingosine reductase [Wickerhamomyces ciferrii]|uniref:3-ketodihydrosphingosine reductase TSC10 n=2 Tax=Wickerhamomyces ciferrii TaxID=1041607 RepID=K0KMR8_WICCF|nr:3-ketodihydrosphingosine reductase [Wickerhamomyces ciferrii]AEX09428.1 3-ketosphinganine reductase [Wickerhamomyces ciferrii]CCH43507.1 3-ketodihydrosphingosine reductase [Wickerhamomyces ciferrii]